VTGILGLFLVLAAAPVEIEIGLVSSDEAQLQWMRREIDAFNQQASEIRVVFTKLECPDRYDTPIEKELAFPANIIGIGSWAGYETAYLAQEGLIVPIDSFFDAELPRDAFTDNLWDAATFNGKTWCVPWAVDSAVMAYNWKMLEDAGIAPPTTGDELMAACPKLTNGEDRYALGATNGNLYARFWAVFTLQKGGSLFKEGHFRFDEPAAKSAYDMMNTIFLGRHALTTPDIGKSKCCGMTFVNEREIWNIDATVYKVAPIPTCGLPMYPSDGRSYLAIRKSTPEKEAASWKLIKWISRKDAPIPAQWKGFPCRKDMATRPEIANDPINRLVFAESAKSVSCLQHIRGRNEALVVVGLAFLTAINTGGSFETFMAPAAEQADAMIQPILPATSPKKDYGLYK